MDTEFTGSKCTIEDKPHEFDTYQDKYRKHRDSAITKFMVTQLGLTTFKWNQTKHKYQGRPFNFLIYPRSIACHHLTTFHVNVSQIKFYLNILGRYNLISQST